MQDNSSEGGRMLLYDRDPEEQQNAQQGSVPLAPTSWFKIVRLLAMQTNGGSEANISEETSNTMS